MVRLAIIAGLVAWSAVGAAAPTPAEQAELDKLRKQLDQQRGDRPFDAVKIARKLYVLQKKLLGAGAPQVELIQQTLAALLVDTGDHAEGLALYEERLKTAERRHGAESREVWMELSSILGVYEVQNRLDETDSIHQRQLAIVKKLDGERSESYARELTGYAVALLARSEYSSAQRVLEQILHIVEANAQGEHDPALIPPLTELASAHLFADQMAKAIPLFDRAIAISDHAPIATRGLTMWGAALQYRAFGREDLAVQLTRRVIALYEPEVARLATTTPDDPEISSMLRQLGNVYQIAGDLAAAERALERAEAIDDRTGKYGYSAWLAQIKRSLGKPKEALALLEKAQAKLSKISPSSALGYDLEIAEVLRELGELPRAEKLYLGHLARLEKIYGKHNRLVGSAQLATSYHYMATGNLGRAEQLLASSLDISERELGLVLRGGTEADHASYFARDTHQIDIAINYQLVHAPRSASAARLGLTTLLRRKGRVLDAAAASLATIRARLSPDDKKLLDDLASARAKLAKLSVAGAPANADHARQVAAVEDQIHKLELAVSKTSAAYRVVTQPVELAAVQKRIPRGARLIEFVSFYPGDPAAPLRIYQASAPRRFAAYVAGETGDPVLVDLGPAAAIDQAVERLRKAVSDPDNDRAPELGRALYDLTLAKLMPALGGATQILIAPDGALSVVPFSALVDDKGRFLIERYTITYLSSGRDLLRLGVKTRSQGGGVIFADPSFDASGAPSKPGARGRRSADLASLHWPPLPGTGQEADAIEKSMGGFRVYRGAAATEAAVKAVHGPRVLHLATHGFFLPEGDSRENPLLRSGLALAGANKLASGDEDGILTALEASGLDLSGTRLVVLSACETGAGKVTNGDGVYGLRRALAIAGAESLVMTLWQVDDLATKELMAGYYIKLRAGRSRASALRDIQLELLARDEYRHPYYWASFLPAGANTALGD